MNIIIRSADIRTIFADFYFNNLKLNRVREDNYKNLKSRGEAKSSWSEGETGIDLTQEAWLKGESRGSNGNVKIWDIGRVIGPNGEIKVNVKRTPSNGMIHGYPVK